MSADVQRPRMSFDAAALEAADLRSMTRSDSNNHMAAMHPLTMNHKIAYPA